NLDFPYDSYTPFDLKELDESESSAEFRFGKLDIRILKEVLEIPNTVTCKGLYMLLKRLSYPCRYRDMIHRLAAVPVLSMITNQTIDYVYNVHGNR
ncbi:unnamed protein product, partial [Pocillopora meandrina]